MGLEKLKSESSTLFLTWFHPGLVMKEEEQQDMPDYEKEWKKKEKNKNIEILDQEMDWTK